MKTFLSILALCLIYSSYSEASTKNPDPKNILLGAHSVPIHLIVTSECAPVVQQITQLQLKYLEQQQAWLKQELTLNQQNRAILLQIGQLSQSGQQGQQEEPIIQSDEIPEENIKEVTSNTDSLGIIPTILTRTGNVARDLVNSAGQLAKDDVDMKAALIGGALGGAGKAASAALQSTGQVAAHAASNIEEGLRNIFSNFGK